MSGSRSPFVYRNPDKFLDGIPLEVYADLYGWSGYKTNFRHYDGPVAAGTDAGIVLASATGTETVTWTSGKLRLAVQALANANVQLEFPVRLHYTVGKRMKVYCRFALSDVDEMLLFFGLATPGDADVFATFPTEGLFFEKASTDMDPDFHVRDAGTSTEDTTLAGSNILATNDTFYILAFEVTTLGDVKTYYGTDINVLTEGTIVTAGTANLPDDAEDEMSLYVGIQAGNSEADYIDLTHIMAIREN